jgi:hypothetical protein
MDKVVRIFENHKDMKTEEYRYWQSRPVHERMKAVTELTIAAYTLKDPTCNVQRLQRTIVVIQRPQR